MLLFVLSPKLLNFTTYLQFSILFHCSTLIGYFSKKLIFSHTKHLILVIPLTVSHSYVSSTLDQLVHRLLSHLVAFSINLVLKSLVDLPTLLLLLYGAHFLLILVIFYNNYYSTTSPFALSPSFFQKSSEPTCFIVLFILKTSDNTGGYLRYSPGYWLISRSEEIGDREHSTSNRAALHHLNNTIQPPCLRVYHRKSANDCCLYRFCPVTHTNAPHFLWI